MKTTKANKQYYNAEKIRVVLLLWQYLTALNIQWFKSEANWLDKILQNNQ